LKRIGSGTRWYLISLVIFAISCCLFVVYTSCGFKNRTLEFLGTKNLVATKGEIALTFYRYNSVFNQTKSYSEIYNIIWTPVFDPKDPDSGWGSRMHKTIFPLNGENVEIVPADAMGYFMDRRSNADTLNGNAYSSSWISSYDVDENDILEASVYCYLSEDCDLSMAEICALGALGNPGASYNLEKKGTWQKLEFRVNCIKGNAGVLLFFSKSGVSDFSSVNGYIIYAYPQVGIKEKNDTSASITGDAKSFNQRINPNGKTVTVNIPDKSRYTEANIFNLNNLILKNISYSVTDLDPIRKWTSNFISEDTTYYGFSEKLEINAISNNFIGARTTRWQFAWQIYTKEYNLKQKILGGGFNFLNWFGYFFLKNKRTSDYPHNPFLTILLYSGIIGLVIFTIFIYYAFYYYYKFIKEYPLLLIFFAITFFFSFFSAGSPFDPPVMGFFVILPFFLNSVLRKNNKNEFSDQE
jgi:hypothetical protein